MWSKELITSLKNHTRFMAYLRFFRNDSPNGDRPRLVLRLLELSAYEKSRFRETEIAPPT